MAVKLKKKELKKQEYHPRCDNKCKSLIPFPSLLTENINLKFNR